MTKNEPRMYIAILCIALYIGAFQYHLQESHVCISLYHVWQYRGYTLRTLQATKHYQIWYGWMRTRIRFRHRLAMRSRIYQIPASQRVIFFSLSSIDQPLQAICNPSLFWPKPCVQSHAKPLKRLKFRLSASRTCMWPPNGFCAFWSDF